LDAGNFSSAVKSKYFTSVTKSKIRLLKCISSQRSLLGSGCVYGGPSEPLETLQDKEEDDAIDHSLRAVDHRELESDPFLEDFLSGHCERSLDVSAADTLDTLSECTGDDSVADAASHTVY